MNFIAFVAYYGILQQIHNELVQHGNRLVAWLRLARRLLVQKIQQKRRWSPTERTLLIWFAKPKYLNSRPAQSISPGYRFTYFT